MNEKISVDTLKQLNSLLEKELITEKDYCAKIKSMFPSEFNCENEKRVTSKSLIWICVGIIAVLALSSIFLLSSIDSKDAEITKLEEKYSSLEEMVKYAYLDTAFYIIDGDEGLYHRYGCPDTPTSGSGSYSFYVANEESARNLYHSKKCKTCFKYDTDEYFGKLINGDFEQ